jgi:hypothetical protein
MRRDRIFQSEQSCIDYGFKKDILSECRVQLAIASTRWYSAAQLAFHLPGQPAVRSIDPNHRSFYSYRDRALDESCPLFVVANAATVDLEALLRDYTN